MIKLVNKNTNVVKEVPEGYSWTTFFFGFLPALFRGDLKWAAIIFIAALAIGAITLGFGGLLVGPIFGFFYNKVYTRDLIEKGYEPVDDYAYNYCVDKGIILGGKRNAEGNHTVQDVKLLDNKKE